nr:hypothetical protein [Tanacetum cinerariifolium]
MKEEKNRALQTINETPTKKAAKRRRLNEKVEDLKRHLEIVPNEDDDVYTEATLLTRKEIDDLIKRFASIRLCEVSNHVMGFNERERRD